MQEVKKKMVSEAAEEKWKWKWNFAIFNLTASEPTVERRAHF